MFKDCPQNIATTTRYRRHIERSVRACAVFFFCDYYAIMSTRSCETTAEPRKPVRGTQATARGLWEGATQYVAVSACAHQERAIYRSALFKTACASTAGPGKDERRTAWLVAGGGRKVSPAVELYHGEGERPPPPQIALFEETNASPAKGTTRRREEKAFRKTGTI